MNYDKTIAFSLSGQAFPSWRTILSTANIGQWHGRTSDEHLNCDIHKCRNLSVCGHATVLNTLFFSKIWHMLRITWIPKGILDKITSISRQFVQRHLLPYISYNVLLQPTYRGGRGLLDLTIQQCLLAYRWFTPLLFSEIPSATAVTWISAHILSTDSFTLPNGRLTFFFPSLRQDLLHSSRPSLCSLWVRAFDIFLSLQKYKLSLGADISQPTQIPASVSMVLSLSEVID
ncbi:hypothetical protein G6F57_017767 [Rhizopus arrhizus]|nr:hypothetical protein G6F57_017767 [Rhizopus arrhizus]